MSFTVQYVAVCKNKVKRSDSDLLMHAGCLSLCALSVNVHVRVLKGLYCKVRRILCVSPDLCVCLYANLSGVLPELKRPRGFRGFRNSAVITGHVSFCPLHVPSAARCTVQNTHWWSDGQTKIRGQAIPSVEKQEVCSNSDLTLVTLLYIKFTCTIFFLLQNLSSHQPLGRDVPLLQITPSQTCERPDGGV